MTNTESLSHILTEFSYRDAMLDIPFKPRAYELAAESVDALKDDVEETWKKGGVKALKELPGIGQHIAEKIDEYFRTGAILEYTQMKQTFPVDIWELSRVEGLGPKHIQDLYTYLKIKNVNDLKHALAQHRIQTIPRWGKKSEEKLAKGLGLMESASARKLLGAVLPIAEEMVTDLLRVEGVKRCVYAGSLRRMQETIGDIDLIATSDNPEKVMNAFTSLPHVETIHEKGKTRSSVRLDIGIDADLRVVPDNVFGATLQYFTGDKRHNVFLREHALSKGFILNEYGLFRRHHPGKEPIARATEEEIYKKLGMDTPPPELRVGGDEIEAALHHRLPDLIPYGSVKGDMQVQTNWSDGNASIEEMVEAARSYGLSYIAITDHTQALAFIGGLNEKRLAEQGKKIDHLNKTLRGFTIFKGTECDILKDGSLDLTDDALATLDWVGISIHSSFVLPRGEQTKRILKAISHPSVTCFFHPTARAIGKREPIEFDFDEILAAAKKYHVALEINGSPRRSDLRDAHVRAAIKAGVTLVIDSDAHSPEQFSDLRLAEGIARRGWATKANILNTRTAAQMKAYIKKKHA